MKILSKQLPKHPRHYHIWDSPYFFLPYHKKNCPNFFLEKVWLQNTLPTYSLDICPKFHSFFIWDPLLKNTPNQMFKLYLEAFKGFYQQLRDGLSLKILDFLSNPKAYKLEPEKEVS